MTKITCLFKYCKLRKYRELKSKYSDSLLDYKRLQDRFDSLEFYSRSNPNSSTFHSFSRTAETSTAPLPRARTPAPLTTSSSTSTLPRTSARLPSSSSYSSNGTGGLGLSSSRQSSVERDYSTPLPSYGGGSSSSSYRHSDRLSDLSSTIRSRQSSPLRSYETSAAYRTLNFTPSSYSLSSSSAGLPPAYDSYRTRREASTERSLANLRNRREASQERSYGRSGYSSLTSGLLKHRRSSFVDNSPSSFKYYY